MNVLFVCEYEWFKSVVFDIHVLSEGLSLLGHQVYAIDYEWDDKSQVRFKTVEVRGAIRVYPEARVILRRPGFVRIRLRRPAFAKLLLLEYLSTVLTHYLEIGKVLQDRHIDVIVLYSVLTNGLPAVRWARKFGIPVVFRNIDMLHKLSPNPMKRLATKFFEKRVYPKMDAVLALTPKYAEYLKHLGADESKVRLLLFPIDTKLFHPGIDCSEIRQRWGLTEKDQVIVLVGTLYRFSGLNEFIRQFQGITQQLPEAKLLIVGDGPLRLEMERTIAELGLEGRVIITGYQAFQTMPQYINLAMVCINVYPITSVTKDLFSAKIIQYLACGKSTVSTSLPGITTLIRGESCGVVYVDSVASMVIEVVHLLKSPERREQLGQAGLDYVMQEHSYEKIVPQFETILEEVVREKRRKTRT